MDTQTHDIYQGLYHAAHLPELGVTMEEFRQDPDAALVRAGQYDAVDMLLAGMRPLLPAQVRLRQALEKQWERDGQTIERRERTRVVVRTKEAAAT